MAGGVGGINYGETPRTVVVINPSTGLAVTVFPPDLSGNSGVRSIVFSFNGGGSAITANSQCEVEVPYACTILSHTLLLDQSGSIVIDLWKDTYANYPPTVADTITASAKPTVTTATKAQDTTLTGWTVAVAAGSILKANVDSITTATRATLILKVRVT